MWISEASLRQYSVDEFVKKIFGTRRRAAKRASRPSLRPVTGSVFAISLNGNALLIVGCSDAEGCPKRWLKSPPRLPPEHPVEHDALLFVLTKSEVKKLPQIPATLRCAEGVGTVDLVGTGIPGRGAAVTQKRNRVARHQQSQPNHRSPCRGVDHVVDVAGFEAGGEIDVVGVRDHPSRYQLGERPFLAGDIARGGAASLSRTNSNAFGSSRSLQG
jgi:hypothetical protein